MVADRETTLRRLKSLGNVTVLSGEAGNSGRVEVADEEFKRFAALEPQLASQCMVYERIRGSYSALQRERLSADCTEYLPGALRGGFAIDAVEEAGYSSDSLDDRVKSFFPSTLHMKPLKFERSAAPAPPPKPVRVGVVLSGGQAPGGHNVICGIFDRVKSLHPDSRVFGFLDGPHGIFTGNFYLLTPKIIDGFRNTGGFDMLGSGRHKIESDEHFAQSLDVCDNVLGLDGLVVIGGDDSNTNAALVGEYFRSKGSKCKVVGAPKTIDGDLKVMPYIPVSFGFDTACRTFSELVGNCCVDSLSAQKYYHFVRLMGRSASNIALECALQTLPNFCFVGEEVKANKWGLKELTRQLADMIESRYASQSKTYGVVLLPEGLIEFIPEFEKLIAELNELGDSLGDHAQPSDVAAKLSSAENRELFEFLPLFLQQQLLLDRDPHGNVQVAKIETEKLLAATVRTELEKRMGSKEKAEVVFQPQFHAFGYEGRAGLPTLFDSAYCYALGATAAQLIISGKTGLIASVTGLEKKSPADWECGGVPVTSLCVIERRKGKDKPVIRKALVELLDDPNFKTLNNSPFHTWNLLRELCQTYDLYKIPGPAQFDSDSLDIPFMLRIELQGSAPMLTAMMQQVTGLSPDIDVKDGEEAFFSKLLKTCKSQFGQSLEEKQVQIGWPLAGEKFGFVGGTRPKSALEIRRGLEGYDIPVASFGLQGDDEDEEDASSASATNLFFSPEACEDVVCVEDETTQCMAPEDEEYLRKVFPNTYGRPLVEIVKSSASASATAKRDVNKDMGVVGIVFCGRQTPGGHDVIAGLWDMCNGKDGSGSVRIVGFIGGSRGFFAEQMVDLTAAKVDDIRHTGGFNLFGRTQDKFCKDRGDADKISKILRKHGISSLVLVGGNRTCNSACYLAEYLEEQNVKEAEKNPDAVPMKVVSVALSQGGSFTNEFIEQPLGFDSTSKATACLAGNTEIDGSSARKYYYFLRTMEGGTKSVNASHLTLEVGLQAKPNYIIIGEECSDKKQSLNDIVSEMADMVQRRWEGPGKKNFGTVIVPDNLVAVIPELRTLMSELSKHDGRVESISAYSQALLKSLPHFAVEELLNQKTIDLQQIQTERMLAEMVKEELKQRPSYQGSFSAVCQFLGYQTRGSLPSVFDSNYGYALGGGVAILLRENRNGYMASVANLHSSESTKVFGVPLAAMLEVKVEGQEFPEAAIYCKMVDLRGKAYLEWKRVRAALAANEYYENPGPIQFKGDCANLQTKLIGGDSEDAYGKHSYLAELASLRENALALLAALRPGVSSKKLRIANSSLTTLRSVLEEL